MNYRGLILSLIALVAVVTGIFFAVRGLHHRDEPVTEPVALTVEDSHFPLLTAVPSDAAVILSMDGGRSAVRHLTDSASVLAELVSGGKEGIPRSFVKEVASRPLAVSMHDAGGLIPLVIVNLSGADSASVATLTHLADSIHLRSRYLPDEELGLFSVSETLVGSSERHLEGGISILDTPELLSAAAALPSGNAIFLSHNAASRIIRTLLSADYLPYASFLSKAAVWAGFSLPDKAEDPAEGISFTTGSSYCQGILAGMTPGDFRFQGLIPSDALTVMALRMENTEDYLALRRKWVDAGGRLSAYKDAASSAKKTLGKNAEQYMTEFGLREAVTALLPSGERLVALRYAERLPEEGGLTEYKAGFALSMLLGEAFRPQADTLWSTMRDGWKLIGSRRALTRPAEKTLREHPVASALIPGSGVFVLYNAGVMGAKAMPDAYALSAIPDAGGVRYSLSHQKSVVLPSVAPKPEAAAPKAPAAAGDSLAESPEAVPALPVAEYQVRNFKTGQINTFCQNADLSLELRDEKGKVQWTVPFTGRIASSVEEIDYYGNGKIQYIFASGKKLYIIDRLGRFVPSFGTELPGEVLAGPRVYAPEGGDPALLVLHTDNTLILYTLDGGKPSGWKDIAPKETVTGLPEALTVGDEVFWKVPTSSGDLYYPLSGGSPLKKSKVKKLLKKTVLKSE